jgi:UDP-N-acetylmuramoylalanine--D-glutamate ligase
VPLTPHPDELSGREVLLLGLGAFGGGAGCARALAQRGAKLTISDLRSEQQLADSLATLEGIEFRPAFGGHREELFRRAEFVVVNPAVPESSTWLEVARAAGCILTTEVNLALRLIPHVPCAAITGTHGKSSTAALLAHMLRLVPGRTVLGGNLGGSLLEQVEGLTAEDQLVVELSSFQLERLDAPPAWPQIALFTCLRPDHLDRHGDMQAYSRAKMRLLAFQSELGLALMPNDEAALDGFAAAARGRVERFSPEQLQASEWGLLPEQLPWQESYRASALLMAVRAALDLGLPTDRIGEAISGFVGLPHRLQELAAPQGYRWIDNGVATHPEATAAAVQSLAGPISLLVGGYDKGLPLGDLPWVAGGCAQLHLFGAGGKRLFQALAPDVQARARIHASCRAAIDAALAELPVPAASLLFSPSFASFDEFQNFRERARLFQESCASFLLANKRVLVTKASKRTKD